MRRRVLTVMMFAAAVMGISGRQSFSQTVSRVELHAVQTTTPPKLDGVLDETVWTSEPMLLEGWASYNPLRGEPARQRTSVWIASDADALYFAFRCFDEEPSKIRTTTARALFFKVSYLARL